ncbi:MAG: hypothetical protein K6F63_06325 [Lachnospiraceae bacterium]|nr:hypothetical protein [Lachnospiraceae bacterium]
MEVIQTQLLLEAITKRMAVVKRAIRKAEQEKDFPDGHLSVSKNPKQCRFYLTTEDGNLKKQYIPVGQSEFVRALAQKEYRQRFLNMAEKEIKILEDLQVLLKKKNADLVYEKLGKVRKNLVSPYIVTDKMYVEKWQAQTFKTNNFMAENKIYDTQKGEKVRSKSEAILADICFGLGIPYHYEKPLKLSDGRVRYPDFTLLKISTREEIFLEHFGLMDDDEYFTKSLEKLDEYRDNGIYPGKNLLFTYETEDAPFDIKGIRTMLKELFNV